MKDFLYRLFAQDSGEPDDEKIQKYLSFFFGLFFGFWGLFGSSVTMNYCLAMVGILLGRATVSGISTQLSTTKITQTKIQTNQNPTSPLPPKPSASQATTTKDDK